MLKIHELMERKMKNIALARKYPEYEDRVMAANAVIDVKLAIWEAILERFI
jgi:hypothetical protein